MNNVMFHQYFQLLLMNPDPDPDPEHMEITHRSIGSFTNVMFLKVVVQSINQSTHSVPS
jgi:hypothetical protein